VLRSVREFVARDCLLVPDKAASVPASPSVFRLESDPGECE
jgi:hypothetical protein